MGKKIVFRKIRGRIIPIEVDDSLIIRDDATNILEAQRARKFLKEAKKSDPLMLGFWKGTKQNSKLTGQKISKRVAWLKKMRRNR